MITSQKRKKLSFNIFKGVYDSKGKVVSSAALGKAILYEGNSTYNLYIDTFMTDGLNLCFYMLPESDSSQPHNFIILTRKKSLTADKKYMWKRVGRAYLFDNKGDKCLNLDWDFFRTEHIYMDMKPKTIN